MDMKNINRFHCLIFLLAVFGILTTTPVFVFAQAPQDNWYLDATWNKSGTGAGTLSGPYGVAIGPDGRIYVADVSKVVIYNSAGTFLQEISGTFSSGDSFSAPRGMIIDKTGKLYVADSGRNAVFVFRPDGTFLLKVGGVTGAGDGQLSGVADVGVDTTGEIYVLENGNCRVSVFNANGTFLRKWSGPGALSGQLTNPISIAVADDGRIYICQNEYVWQKLHNTSIKEFTRDGIFVRSASTYLGWNDLIKTGQSVRFDPGGYAHVMTSYQGNTSSGSTDPSPVFQVYNRDLAVVFSFTQTGIGGSTDFRTPCHAIGPDGTIVLSQISNKSLRVFKTAYRGQSTIPRNAIPFPAVSSTAQRPNSPFIDIDYQVTDADDSTVQTGLLIFKNGTQSLANCINNLTLVEGTDVKLGTEIASNQKHRVTWNSGADWTTPLADFKVAILAKDSRQKLLDIHYLDLPAAGGVGPLRISRSPLIESDYMQVWWWLLATHDTGIRLDPTGKIYGVGGIYDGLLLCDGSIAPATKPDGRNYIFAKLGVREATTAEVAWAKSGSSAGTGTSTVNVWPPGRQVGGRPKNVNEYGFDTGDWSAASYNARWVIATH